MVRFLIGTTRTMLMGVAVALTIVPAALAQRVDPSAVYLYKGADRDQRLLDAAKKEGTLTFYTSMQTPESGPLSAAFEKKYGIKVNLWRATSEQVVQRAITEARGNRNTMDVVETNAPSRPSASTSGALDAKASSRNISAHTSRIFRTGRCRRITSGRVRAPICGLSRSTPTR